MDIFAIKSIDSCLELNGKMHRIIDPPFLVNVELRRKHRELDQEKDKLDPIQFAEKFHQLEKEGVKMHIPSITEEELNAMGRGAFDALVGHISELVQKKFGATIQKVEEKKP